MIDRGMNRTCETLLSLGGSRERVAMRASPSTGTRLLTMYAAWKMDDEPGGDDGSLRHQGRGA